MPKHLHTGAVPPPQSQYLEVMIDGIRLHAHIQDLYPHGIARLRLGPLTAPRYCATD